LRGTAQLAGERVRLASGVEAGDRNGDFSVAQSAGGTEAQSDDRVVAEALAASEVALERKGIARESRRCGKPGVD
jgi:hypothetical protein